MKSPRRSAAAAVRLCGKCSAEQPDWLTAFNELDATRQESFIALVFFSAEVQKRQRAAGLPQSSSRRARGVRGRGAGRT